MSKTGATRYQKFLKSEKSKTKLKGKKDLPKGTNVTKTNFKVKKIVIKEQLKKHGEHEALSSRKLNINELISRLGHFNIQSRLDALNGLRELINEYPYILQQNLAQVIHGVTPLVLNIEKSVRKESLKILNLMLSTLSSEKVDPFFDILSTYLRSSMTHIDSRIQEDSLLFLDVMLLCTSDKLAQDFHKIIPNFLDMISKLQLESKSSRTLTVNLNSQVTSIKWRSKVLQRLKEFLNKFLSYYEIGLELGTKTKNTLNFAKSNINDFVIVNKDYAKICSLPCFSHNLADNALSDETEKIQNYIDTLMPLLFQIWFEACPNINSEPNTETVISEDTAFLLINTLQVLTSIWKLVQHYDKISPGINFKADFIQKYKLQFSKSFVLPFPFITNIRSKQKSKATSQDESISDTKLVAENLGISYMFVVLNPNINVKIQQQEIAAVLNYIQKTLKNEINEQTQDYVFHILHTIFSETITNWNRTMVVMESILLKIVQVYFDEEISNSCKQKIFSLLCNIALNDTLIHFRSSEAYIKWIKHLPDVLLQDSITTRTIDIIYKFAISNNTTFNSVIQPKLIEMIKNLPKIKISDSNNDNAYHKLFSLLYWIKCWDDESLNLLENQLLENTFKSDYGKFIFDTMKLKI